MGFDAVARHRSKAITLYRQGDVNYLVNEEPGSQATKFAADHGPCASAMAFRVVDAKRAFDRAVANGGEPADPADGSLAMDVPAVKGIGGSLLYFLDKYGANRRLRLPTINHLSRPLRESAVSLFRPRFPSIPPPHRL